MALFGVWYTVYQQCETTYGPRFWSFTAMAQMQQTLYVQRQSQQERAEQQARKQRVAASICRIHQRYAPLRPVVSPRSS